jgi:hypothetical protein
MKKVSLVPAIAALLISGSVMASEGKPSAKEPESKICAQIGDLLETNSIEVGGSNDLTASVTFMLNGDMEIVVLTVDTEDERLEGFVKARLNYQKVADKNLRAGKVYEVPIRITA